MLAALYDSREESSPRTSQIHRFLEMPANHLGFDIHYYDVGEPLPKLGDDVAGILIWFNSGNEVPDAKAYLDWLKRNLAAGKNLVIFENGGIGDKWRKDPAIVRQWNEVLNVIGLTDDNSWSNITYPATIEPMDEQMIGFEHNINPPLSPFGGIHVTGNAVSHLRVHLSGAGLNDHFDLVTTGSRGGFVSQGYAMFYFPLLHELEEGSEQPDVGQWIVNHFSS